MALSLPPDLVPTFVSGFLGVADVADGPTVEQRSVIGAIARHLWKVDAATHAPLGPDAVAAAIASEALRRRFLQMAIVVQCCRHPVDLDQERRLEQYAEALAFDGPQLDVLRSWIHNDAVTASRDFVRIYQGFLPDLSEPLTVPADDGDVLPQVRALAGLPEGTLGWAYLRFYERHGFHLPGPHTPEPAYYISHDMNHVIAGYEPTGPGEISLGAFKVTMSDTDANWMAFMTNLMIQEAGLIKHGTTEEAQFIPYGGAIYPDAEGEGALHLPGAAEMLAEAFERGAQVRGDFSQIDHLAIAHRPLAEIREEYHVVPRSDGIDEGLGIGR